MNNSPLKPSASSSKKINTPPTSTKRNRSAVGTSLKDNTSIRAGKNLTLNVYPISKQGLLSNRRVLVVLLVLILALIGILGYFVTYTKSCSKQPEQAQVVELGGTDGSDERIEQGTAQTLAVQLTPILNRNDKLSWIAKNTSKYPDTRIIELALREPDAIDFVYQWPSAKKEAQPFTGGVLRGTAPQFFSWDLRWANVDFAGIPLAVTGDVPCVASMAYMATTGNTDKTPATMGQIITSAGLVDERGNTSTEFFKKTPAEAGISFKSIDPNAQSISEALGQRNLVAAHLVNETHPELSHWVLIADHSQTGALVIYDPVSSQNSAHLWDPADFLSQCDELYVVAS